MMPSETDIAMMRRAVELAREGGAQGEAPVGAVVYETMSGQVLAEAFNRREMDADPSAHAEHIAIARACKERGDWRLPDCTVCVTLEPCPMCAGLLVAARVGRLIYGAPDPKAGAIDTLYTLGRDTRLNHRVESTGGVLADEAGALLTAFFRRLRDASDR